MLQVIFRKDRHYWRFGWLGPWYSGCGTKKPRLQMVDWATETPLTATETSKIFSTYRKKMVKRMNTFLIEARRMDKKLKHVMEKLEELGVVVDGLGVNAMSSEQIMNNRRRPRTINLAIDAHKDHMKLRGSITVTPSMIKLQLDSKKYYGAIYEMKYFKTLMVKDNYFVAMVKFSKRDSRHELFDAVGELEI